MKKIQIVFLFMFLVGCSSSPEVPPTVILGIIQTPSPFPTQTVMPPIQILTPTSTFAPIPTQTPIGGGAGKIAFVSERDGYQEIYVVNSDGNNLTKMANGITPKFDPAWSPDGRKIAFASYDPNDDSGSLYIMNVDGSNPIKLIDTKRLDTYSQATSTWRLFYISHPVWSPDSKQIGFSHGYHVGCCSSRSYLSVMNVDGSNLVSVRGNSWGSNFAWSPDSQKIVFDSDICGGNFDICLMNADGTELINLTNKKGGDGGPSWSPNGKKIAFISSRYLNYGNFNIFLVNADGTNPINLTPHLKGWAGVPSWSPNGGKIVFASPSDGNNEIYVINSDGTNLINLTNNLADDSNPVWSPDGKKIVLISYRDENSEIYVMNIDDGNLINLTNNDAKDYSPIWSP